VVANGKIQPVVQVKLSPEVSGEIIELPVKEGQAVTKGDLLVKIKPDPYIANLNSVRAIDDFFARMGDGNDTLQETFLRLTTEARAGRAPEQVRAWLFRVASNLAISRARRHATANTYMGRYGQAEHDGMVMDSPEASALRRERNADRLY